MKEERITITLDNLGEITTTKDVFNEIAIVFGEARNQYRTDGCFALEKREDKIRSTIHEELDKRGYYNIYKSWFRLIVSG